MNFDSHEAPLDVAHGMETVWDDNDFNIGQTKSDVRSCDSLTTSGFCPRSSESSDDPDSNALPGSTRKRRAVPNCNLSIK
jgi:hypothetical protein